MHQEPTGPHGPGRDASDALGEERDRLRAIVESMTEIVSLNLDTGQLLERVAQHAMRMTRASGALVALEAGDALEYAAAAGSVEPFRGSRLSRARSLSGLAADQRTLQYSGDTWADDRVDAEACRKVNARSSLAVPLCHMDQVAGVLTVVSDRTDAFGETDRHALQMAAGLLGAAIGRQRILDENRRLFEERSMAQAQAETVFNASPVATVVHDLDGTVRMWNAAAAELFGWSQEEVVGGLPPNLGEGGVERFQQITRRILREGTAATEIVRRPRRDGTVLDVRISGAPLLDASGRAVGVVRTMEDVTEQRLRSRSQKAATERLRHVIEHSPHAFISMDASGRVLEWNRAAESMFGWARREAVIRPLHELIIPEAAHAAHLQGLQRYRETREGPLIGRRVEVMARHRDGHALAVELLINAVDDGGDPVFDAFIENVSERHAEMDLLRQQALMDALTGLPNRDYFQTSLNAAIERNRAEYNRVAVVLVNLDGFRAINDLFGQATGDALLQATAERLGRVVREQDTVARLGGDEFAVLLDGLRDARSDVHGVANKLLQAFAEPVELRDTVLPLQASIGAAVHEFERDSAEVLLHVAVDAVQRAKRAGGGRGEVLLRQQPG